ncbi:helix-turn-helix domain-containing protein [Salmonella enterica]|uniref:Helix-turn-helix domain-containing protein n=1 Tax=Salmonella enterica TaxID=28901 RepID=A0A5U6SPE6_SALER|nr:helix-turn-helix domain-containing protein [Salmonella enterica]
MHQLFVVSGCSYMLTGLREALADEPVQVVPVKTPEEILQYPSRRGKRVILVFAPKREPVAAARSMVFLWRWVKAAGKGNRLPVLLMSDIRQYLSLYGACSLAEHLPVSGLRAAVLDAFQRTGNAGVPAVKVSPSLSKRQYQVLLATLAGVSVPDTARMLDISESMVFSARSGVIDKLGLRNRVVLMSLSLKDFI